MPLLARRRAKGNGERHPVRTITRFCAAILVALALTVAGYVVYLNVNYTRIADGIEVTNEGAEPKTVTLAKGVTYTALTCDGFIVSGNVHAAATTVDTGFATSDHNPVLLTFTLE